MTCTQKATSTQQNDEILLTFFRGEKKKNCNTIQ